MLVQCAVWFQFFLRRRIVYSVYVKILCSDINSRLWWLSDVLPTKEVINWLLFENVNNTRFQSMILLLHDECMLLNGQSHHNRCVHHASLRKLQGTSWNSRLQATISFVAPLMLSQNVLTWIIKHPPARPAILIDFSSNALFCIFDRFVLQVFLDFLLSTFSRIQNNHQISIAIQ